MRILFLFSLFILTQSGIAQNNLKFDQSDFQTIVKKSKAEQKPVLLMLYASWCPHCNKMKSEVFNDTLVTNLLTKNYICTSQDIDQAEGNMLRNKFNIISLPTFIFFDSNGNELYRLKGEYNTTNLVAEIKNALDPKKQLPYLEKKFMADPSNTGNWLNYMNVLKKGRERSGFSEAAHKYLATQTDEQLLSSTNWGIIANSVTDISSREFQFVLQHQVEFGILASPSRVDRKIKNIVAELLQPYTESLDTINYFKQRQLAKTIQTQKIDSLIFSYDLTIFERSKSWNSYKKSTIESTEKFAWDNAQLLKDISRNYLKHVNDIPSLNYAIKWTTRSLELNDSYDGNLMLSVLYLKINDRKNTVLYARKAKIICTDLKFNSKDVDALFLKLGIK